MNEIHTNEKPEIETVQQRIVEKLKEELRDLLYRDYNEKTKHKIRKKVGKVIDELVPMIKDQPDKRSNIINKLVADIENLIQKAADSEISIE